MRAFPTAAIDDAINELLERGRVPGAALAVVQNGELIHARGYGMRSIEHNLAMTPDTIYPIASTSKAMNATLLGMLVDEGKLGWDIPVRDYIPRFALVDDAHSHLVTLRDLVLMRTGLPRHDWVWSVSTYDRSELVERLRHLDPAAGFRERFQYSNLTTTLAGHIAELVTGQSWEALAHERLFAPLGMNATRCDATAPSLTASYHETSARELVRTTPFVSTLTAPSGGAIHSSVEDMSLWLMFNLAKGRANGRQLVSEQTLAEIHTGQVATLNVLAGLGHNPTYGLAWIVDTYNGQPRISHGGYLNDVHSDVHLYPELAFGVVSFTNFGCPVLAGLINETVLNLSYGLKPRTTLADKLALYESNVEARRNANAAMARTPSTSPSHPLERHAGRYRHPGYGQIDIAVRDETLEITRGALRFALEHWHFDAWVGAASDLFPIHTAHPFEIATPLQFETGPDGNIAALHVHFEPATPPIRFAKESGDGG